MLRLRIAGGNYARTRALADQTVRIDGAEVTYLHMPARESIYLMATEEAFDVAEFSISQLMIENSRDIDRFVALPVFPARSFRHRDIYLGRGSDITEPGQLRGRRIALQRYHVSASVWTRGILAEYYGLKPTEVTWCKADIRRHGQPPTRVQLELPDDIRIHRIADASIDELLRSGKIDAAILPEAPPCYADPSSGVERLFRNTADAERDYFARSGIFPILHVIVMRRSLHKSNPDLAAALYEAYERARRRWRDNLIAEGMQEAWQPFTVGQFPRGTAEDVDRFWPYGLAANCDALETVIAYAWEQGLLRRRLDVDELFWSGTDGGTTRGGDGGSSDDSNDGRFSCEPQADRVLFGD